MRRERNDPRDPGDDGRARSEEEILAAIAAVEGWGVAARGSEVPDGVELDPRLVDQYELAAGALFSAMAPGGAPKAPADLVDRLLATTGARGLGEVPFDRRTSPMARGPQRRPASPYAGPSSAPDSAADATPGSPPRSGVARQLALVGGWAAAALLALYVAVGSTKNAGTSGGAPTVDAQGAAQVRALADAFGQREDTVHSAWSVGDLEGEVLWSDAENAGFMYIDGLPENDPEVSQYQLWIFRGTDPGAEPHPVDGGVFDVTGDGAVVVPIDAKLNVGSAGLFAVTVEQPGGVVVSERESIVAVAVRS